MGRALARHDAIVHDAIRTNRGHVLKTTGDGVYAAFDDPLDALHATVAFQSALTDPAGTEGIAIRVRCGLHLGTVERRNDDYFGNPVNRTARLMSVAHGGQILVSQAVADEVNARLPERVELHDLGNVRLKDLATPERVYQVLHPDLRQDFPALRSLEATPNNLPQQLTSFVGRERELSEASALLRESRLVTLLGMGGLGKTRLSMQIAADAMDRFPDGVWFVDLAPVVDPAFAPSTLAQVLNVREEPGKPITQTVLAHLRQHRALLILDNCEHLVATSAELANALLRGAPEVRIIATSREALRVPGEVTYAVRPMAVPPRNADVDALERSEFVQLFVERARLVKPAFALTEKDAPAVAELCARLEGIPLALELAAARLRALSVQDINRRLSDRFKLLTGGGRVLLPRQQTLQALVAWSYDMLSENERLLFDRLSVFAGGFALDGAEEVGGSEPLAPEDVLDLLTSLVEKSLVMADVQEDSARYRMLETLRDFGKARLTERNEVAATATRHCHYFLALAKASNAELGGPEQAKWIRRLEDDLDDLRVAIAFALAGDADPVIAVKFEVALMGFRILRGYATEGRKYVQSALALPAVQASNVAHAHALYVGAALADSQGDQVTALRMLEPCLALRRELGEEFDIAATLSTRSIVYLHAGDTAKAKEEEGEAVEIFRRLGDRISEAISLLHLGEICAYDADDAACTYLEQSLAIAREVEYREVEAECERMLGQIAFQRGDMGAARARFESSLATCREAEDKRGKATSTWWLGKIDLADGDLDSAGLKLSEALCAFRDFEMNIELAACIEDHARLAAALDDADTAVHLHAAAAAFRERLPWARPPHEEQQWRAAVATARARLGEGAFDDAWTAGRAWNVEDAISRALSSARAGMVAA